MTQHKLIIEYIKQYGSITPATLTEKQRIYKGGFLGSETIRRCQELENHVLASVQAYPRLYKKRTGKFMTFMLEPEAIKIQLTSSTTSAKKPWWETEKENRPVKQLNQQMLI